MRKPLPSVRGFTLIEIIIAMFILAFLSVFTVQAIQNALKTKTKIQGEIDRNSTLRDALRIMERDINMAFNYHDAYIQLYNQAQDERKKRGSSKTTNPTTPAVGTDGKPLPPAQQAAANIACRSGQQNHSCGSYCGRITLSIT